MRSLLAECKNSHEAFIGVEGHAEVGIEIGEVTTRSYPAAHTGTPMFSVQMFVNIPASLHISRLREEFMDFCDQLNLDAIIEPVKS